MARTAILLVSAQACLALRGPAFVTHRGSAAMASHGLSRRGHAAVMVFGRKAPQEIYDKLSPTSGTAGNKLATPREIEVIWGAFEKAYGNRERALEASRKNSQVLLPFINNAATITGANEALVGIFGKEGALEIITKNPGVLACNPVSLSKTSKKDIENAANLVDSIENIPPNIKSGIPFLTALSIVGTVGTRLVQCGSGTCGADWDLQGGLGPSFIRAVSEALAGS